jgi:hypothetical protein
MNCLFKQAYVYAAALFLSSSALLASTSVSPFLSLRSQGQNSALEMSGWALRLPHDEESGDISLSGEYSGSFKSKEISRSLFGCFTTQNCTTLSIRGSAVANRTENDLLADWFYLPSNYEGTVSIKPYIQSFITTLNFSFSSDELVPGLFLTLRAPLTWTRSNLKSVFFTEDEGTVVTPEGTYLNDAENFFCSKSTSFDTTFSADRLSCARFGCHDCDNNGERSITRLTDIQTNLGYNFAFQNDAYALGLFARLVIPTGNVPRGEWLFEPIVGNGKHWELGGGINGSARVWKNEDDSKQCGFYGDVTLTHLFGTKQNRVFDLKGKPLSRYITAGHFVDGSVVKHAPLANLTSCAMNVSVGIQADIVALFNYTSHNWSYDIGYNLWARSCEKFDCSSQKCSDCCGACVIKKGSETWGISFIGSNDTTSLSTIVEKAAADSTPVFITNNDIDYDGASTSGLSNKFFAHVSYSWLNHEAMPHLGFGGEVEIGSSRDCCSSNNSCCKNVALSQWGVWFKGGASF